MQDSNLVELKTSQGRYKFYLCKENELGRGGFGVVYKGKDHNSRVIAIKILKSSKGTHSTFNVTLGSQGNTIGKEVAAFAALNKCSNTVKLFDYGSYNDKGFIVMEFCEEGSLANLMKKGPCSTKKSLKIFTQIAKGLKDIHALGLMHRDLKPENILCSSGEYKIGDFGLVSKKSYENCCCGTPGFMAPEVLKEKSYSNKCDIFSMGVLLMCLLTGKRPYEIDREAGKINSKIKDFLKDLLNSDPDKRPTARELYERSSKLKKEFSDEKYITCPSEVNKRFFSLDFEPKFNSENAKKKPKEEKTKLQLIDRDKLRPKTAISPPILEIQRLVNMPQQIILLGNPNMGRITGIVPPGAMIIKEDFSYQDLNL